MASKSTSIHSKLAKLEHGRKGPIPFGSPARYRLAVSVDGAELPPGEHERLKWAQEAAAEYCAALAELESAPTSAGSRP